MADRAQILQILNPRTGRYVLVDRDAGEVLEHREEEGPYPGVPVAKWRKILDSLGEPSVPRERIREAVREVAERRAGEGTGS